MTTAEAVEKDAQPEVVVPTSPEPAQQNCRNSTTDEHVPIVNSPKGKVDQEKNQKPVTPCIGKGAALAQQHLNNQKQHLEQRLRRKFIWGTMNAAIILGRLMSKMGADNTFHSLLRKTARAGGGIRLQTLPGISHSKAVISGVKCRIYKPIGDGIDGPLPVFIFIHGGGWVICSARSYHPFTLGLCRDTGAIVVSVDYRLAPENPYPAGLDDCLAVTKAILNADSNPEEICEELNGAVDVNRVVIGGDSAGGNLAACVALDLVRANEQRLKAIILICPVLQTVSQSHFNSYSRKFKNSAGLSWFVAQYAGVMAPGKKLLKLMDNGKHLTEETSQKLIDKFFKIPESPKDDESAPKVEVAAPDSGCQTASSSLPSPTTQDAPSTSKNVEGEETEHKNEEHQSSEDKEKEVEGVNPEPKVSSPQPQENDDQETDQLIEDKIQLVPDCVSYLGANTRAWPLLAEDTDLSKLPSTMVQVCSEDPLLDEGRLFVDRMRHAGACDVRLFNVPRAQHAEPVLGRYMHSKAAKRGYAEIVSFFKDVTGLDREHQETEAVRQTQEVDEPVETTEHIKPVLDKVVDM